MSRGGNRRYSFKAITVSAVSEVSPSRPTPLLPFRHQLCKHPALAQAGGRSGRERGGGGGEGGCHCTVTNTQTPHIRYLVLPFTRGSGSHALGIQPKTPRARLSPDGYGTPPPTLPLFDPRHLAGSRDLAVCQEQAPTLVGPFRYGMDVSPACLHRHLVITTSTRKILLDVRDRRYTVWRVWSVGYEEKIRKKSPCLID